VLPAAGGQLAQSPPNKSRASIALAVGIGAVVLIWPLGLVLGPVGLWLGVTTIRRINRSDGRVGGLGLAVAGVTLSALVCGFYALAVAAEIAAIVLSGGPIPAY
jgi:hypothetical protein